MLWKLVNILLAIPLSLFFQQDFNLQRQYFSSVNPEMKWYIRDDPRHDELTGYRSNLTKRDKQQKDTKDTYPALF